MLAVTVAAAVATAPPALLFSFPLRGPLRRCTLLFGTGLRLLRPGRALLLIGASLTSFAAFCALLPVASLFQATLLLAVAVLVPRAPVAPAVAPIASLRVRTRFAAVRLVAPLRLVAPRWGSRLRGGP